MVAAGRFDSAGNTPARRSSATAASPRLRASRATDVYDLDFDDYDQANPGRYVVTGCALTIDGAKCRVFEVLTPEPDLAIRLRRIGQGSNDDAGFMLQITRFDGGGP